ncbi:MAG: hypothetical protein CMJ35_13590 [Phycisphaerae bacterium]|nr:hypothetical protein [Phycisphaerae bacterium]MBM91504.1 hypothetical protein [Phycisphaerae bacterium]MBM92626.1 hypothetical protein [Phycisphaerae bacterium]HCT45200.1 hypothetical protein [Phycisphaerales bacterium]|tara:strand:+ start:748 stop:1299 length:552 start_codon:yes stop_codon:yes gene_type:complete
MHDHHDLKGPGMKKSMNMRATRPGITLIEAVVSLSIISVLTVGLSSSVMLGARAIPSESELGAEDRAVHDLCNMLRADLLGAYEIDEQVSGNSTRLIIKVVKPDVEGAYSEVRYEFIGDAKMIRRRVDAENYEILCTSMTDYRLSFTSESALLRFMKLELVVEGTIQQRFETFVNTPYRPELK